MFAIILIGSNIAVERSGTVTTTISAMVPTPPIGSGLTLIGSFSNLQQYSDSIPSVSLRTRVTVSLHSSCIEISATMEV